jgi:hypothetical protein
MVRHRGLIAKGSEEWDDLVNERSQAGFDSLAVLDGESGDVSAWHSVAGLVQDSHSERP